MRFALDSCRRLLQMFGSVVLEVPRKHFDSVMEAIKRQEGVAADVEISQHGLRNIVDAFHEVILRDTGESFPERCAHAALYGYQGRLRILEK